MVEEAVSVGVIKCCERLSPTLVGFAVLHNIVPHFYAGLVLRMRGIWRI